MLYRFENGKEAQLIIDTEINVAKSNVWQLLATTEGLIQWFPEMQAENLPEDGKLSFVQGDFYEEMPLLEYVEEAILSYEWATGRVSFNLKEVDPDKTIVHFQEFLPYNFENLAQDLAGWTMKMERLKAISEAETYDFNQELFAERKKEFEALLSKRMN